MGTEKARVKKPLVAVKPKATDITTFKSLHPCRYTTPFGLVANFDSSMRDVTVLFVNVIGLNFANKAASNPATVQTAQIVMVMLQNIIQKWSSK